MEDTINAIGHCIGYGDINAKYNFFALEEKEGKKPNNAKRNLAYVKKFTDLKTYYVLSNEEIYAQCPECRKEDEDALPRIYPTYKFIYEKLSNNNINIEELGTVDKTILIGNLSPFAKPETNSNYQKNEIVWLKNNEEGRSEFIIKLLLEKAKNNNFVFCFRREDYYKNLKKFLNMELDDMWFSNSSKDSPDYYKMKNYHLYLLKHPSRGHLKPNQVEELITSIKVQLSL